MVFQVLTPKPRLPIRCGKVSVAFVAKTTAVKTPTRPVNTPRGVLLISTPEATAFDLIGYVDRSGGLDNVALVVRDLAPRFNVTRLTALAASVPIAWVQRLGFILSFVKCEKKAEPLARFVAERSPRYTKLVRSRPAGNATKSERWRLIVNETLELDT